MTLSCIFEDPNGEHHFVGFDLFARDILKYSMEYWENSLSGEASIMHVYSNSKIYNSKYIFSFRGTDYSLADNFDRMYLRRPILGRMFIMIDDMVVVDEKSDNEIYIGDCGGNPYPIHKCYTINDRDAIMVINDFILSRNKSLKFKWMKYTEMPIKWDLYI